MKVTVPQILDCVALCAGEAPFLVLDAAGEVLTRSVGAAALEGARITLEGRSFTLSGDRWGPEVPADIFGRGEAAAAAETAAGPARFRLSATPLPAEAPELWLLRLEPVAEPADAGGARIREPRSFGDALCFHGMWTRAAAMKETVRNLERIAESGSTVLVRGESGTGKEHVARALHELSKRRGQPFVAVNCAALMPSLLESELFGHVKGAFTGAIKARAGLFEQANGGSIFLDEVAEMPLELQSKLLRVLEERKITPVGGARSRTVDVRLISATHQSLRRAVAAGRFREDLMYRLRVVPIFIPPLRERRGDIELLVSVFVHAQIKRGARGFSRVEPEAMRALLDYPWPGNVRELSNAIEYACVVGRSEALSLADLPPEFREGDLAHPIQTAEPRAAERALPPEARELARALERAGGHKARAAEELGMHRTTLWRKLKQYGLG